MGKRFLAHGKVGGKVNPSFLLGFHFPFPWERTLKIIEDTVRQLQQENPTGSLSVRFWVSSKEFWSVEMCNYQPWEEDSLQSEDYVQSTAEGVDVVETGWGARLAMLEARITRVEARVERLEAKMLHLQKGMNFVCALFLFTLMYAIFK
ncbi:hypothetical protein Pyn_33332 [Prunus yedoensis var. nudiflora]|uniref:Uncharacterized protein n=1 Tax=Prunus yedoensis var. nudiflora TaxID=2094558 RepID=A0A314YVP7_PRUYE|nr:hypothetical protein Pyn_33332 [Prunus yedoensis var. nudiflora]